MKNSTRYLFTTLVVLLVIAIVFQGCGSNKETTASTKKQPDWVGAKPISSLYYSGIGVAQKRFNPVDFQAVAKRNALNDLATEISVTISANSLLHSLETNNRFREDYMSSTRLKATETLEGFELVDAHETDEAYYLYYRLSKSDYQSQKQAAMEQASRKAINFYGLAAEDLEMGDIAKALRKYLKAIEAVQLYLNEPLEANLNGQVYLGNELYLALERTLSSINFKAPKEYSVKYGEQLNSTYLEIFAQHTQDKPVINTPFQLSLNGKALRSTTSAINGKLIFDLSKDLTQTQQAVQVGATLDKAQLFGDEFKGNKTLQGLIDLMPAPSHTVYVDFKKPALFINGKESNLGMSSAQTTLLSLFRAEAIQQGFKVVDAANSADLVVTYKADTQPIGEQFGMFTAAANVEVQVTDATTQSEVFSIVLPTVRGANLNYEQAGKTAITNLGAELGEKFFQPFTKTIF